MAISKQCKVTELDFSLVISTSELAMLYCLQLTKTLSVSVFFMFSMFFHAIEKIFCYTISECNIMV